MIIKEEFFKIEDKIYPCISFYDCLLGVGDETYIFNDRIKETHYINIHRDSLFKISLCEGSMMRWMTKNGSLIVRGRFVEPAYVNLSLVDIGDDISAKECLNSLNFFGCL